MKDRGALFILLGVALLAAAQAGAAQSTPSYRPPRTAPAGSSGSASTPGQCGTGTSTPAGATSFASGTGKVPASGGGKQAYSQIPLNLANYSVGGQLAIQVRVSGGSGSATFELFLANTTFGANGAPSAQALTTQTVATGGCATLTYNFSQGANYILAVTGGSSGAPGGATFQYSASVEPSFAGVFSPVTGTQPPTLATPAPAEPAPATASAQPAATQPTVAQPAAAVDAPTEGASTEPTPIQNPNASSPNTPLMIQSVTIQNSPGVPDTGGHCIICGLVTGNLTAVEPNLVICVTPTGRKGAARSCTGVCNPGHDCNAPFGSRVMLLASSHTVHVEVLDNDKEGKITPLAAFDESDAAQCTADQPCKVDDADDQAAGTLVSFGFGVPEGCVTSASDAGSGSIRAMGQTLVASTLFLPGLLPAQTSPSARSAQQPPPPPTCRISFTSYSGAIASEQLYDAFLSLWGKGSKGEPGSKLFQKQIGKIPASTQVNVFVVDEDSKCKMKSGYDCYLSLRAMGVAAYSNYGNNNQEAAGQRLGYVTPGSRLFNSDEFAFTVPTDTSHATIDVVMSAKFLEDAYYATLNQVGQTVPSKLPIQLTLAYELGSNVVGLATDKKYVENSHQTTTNCIMKEAFPSFPLNVSFDRRQVGSKDNLPIYQDFATTADVEFIGSQNHPVLDEFTGEAYLDNPGPDPQTPTTYWSGDPKPGPAPDPFSFSKQDTLAAPPVQPEVNLACEDVKESKNSDWVGGGPYDPVPDTKPVNLYSTPPNNQQ